MRVADGDVLAIEGVPYGACVGESRECLYCNMKYLFVLSLIALLSSCSTFEMLQLENARTLANEMQVDNVSTSFSYSSELGGETKKVLEVHIENAKFFTTNSTREEIEDECATVIDILWDDLKDLDTVITQVDLKFSKGSYEVTVWFPIDDVFSLASNMLQKRKEYAEAIEASNKAIALNSNNGTHFNNRGWALYKLKRYKPALKDLIKAGEMGPDRQYVMKNIGMCYFKMEEYEKALEFFNRSIALDSTYLKAYTGRGRAYYKLGNIAAGKKDLKRALTTEPNNTYLLGQRAECYLENDHVDSAAVLIDQIVFGRWSSPSP